MASSSPHPHPGEPVEELPLNEIEDKEDSLFSQPLRQIGTHWLQRWVAVFSVVILFAMFCGLMYGNAYLGLGRTPDRAAPETVGTAEGVTIIGLVTQLDLVLQQATIVWTLLGCGTTYFARATADVVCGIPSIPLLVYVDGNTDASAFTNGVNQSLATYSSQPTPSIDDFDIFNFTGGTASWVNTGSRRGRIPTFTTTPAIDAAFRMETRVSVDSVYPRDQYIVLTTFLIIDPSSSQPVPITGLTAYDVVDSWIMSWQVFALPADDGRPRQTLFLNFIRDNMIRGYSIGVFCINWAIALAVSSIAVYGVFLRRDLSETIVLIPVTVLFAMPALRAALPTPEVGNGVDQTGFILSVLFVAVAAALMLGDIVCKAVIRGEGPWVRKLYNYVGRRYRARQVRRAHYPHDYGASRDAEQH